MKAMRRTNFETIFIFAANRPTEEEQTPSIDSYHLRSAKRRRADMPVIGQGHFPKSKRFFDRWWRRDRFPYSPLPSRPSRFSSGNGRKIRNECTTGLAGDGG